MLVNREREKLINAILFFAQNTNYLGKTKLFKLLYFLDFTHFKETGRSVTGLGYSAWKMGPVPVELFEEISTPKSDMAEKLRVSEKELRSGSMLTITPLAHFDAKYFSKRELGILQELAVEFKNSKADDMIEATHLENLPWHKVFVVEGKKQEGIPYEYAIRKQEEENMNDVISEHEAIVRHFNRK